MVSYADFVTLLFAFFVVLFACAETDKIKILARPVHAAALQPLPKPELAPTLELLRVQLRQEMASGQIRMHLEPRGLVLALSQAAFFPSGGDRLDPALLPGIRKIAAAVRDLPNSIRLEGHTDSEPLSHRRLRDNWELSAVRALAMLQALNSDEQIARERLAIAGYADTAPVTSNDTEEGRSRNRRVDIVILSR